jgi:predicted transcriptional regulator
MDRVMSARIDDSVFNLIERLARERKLTKKRIIEEAIKDYWGKIHTHKDADFFQDSFGAWKRDEPVDTTIRKSKEAFNQSIKRHHLSGR